MLLVDLFEVLLELLLQFSHVHTQLVQSLQDEIPVHVEPLNDHIFLLIVGGKSLVTMS